MFRWRPGNDARYKKTIICQEVAKQKNVCQVCLFDLDYGLPVQVRDTALGIEKEDIPESDVGKEFQLNERIQQGETDSSFGGARPNDMLLQLQRTTPYYKVCMCTICHNSKNSLWCACLLPCINSACLILVNCGVARSVCWPAFKAAYPPDLLLQSAISSAMSSLTCTTVVACCSVIKPGFAHSLCVENATVVQSVPSGMKCLLAVSCQSRTSRTDTMVSMIPLLTRC